MIVDEVLQKLLEYVEFKENEADEQYDHLWGNVEEMDACPGVLDYTEGLRDAYGRIAATLRELLGKS